MEIMMFHIEEKSLSELLFSWNVDIQKNREEARNVENILELVKHIIFFEDC